MFAQHHWNAAVLCTKHNIFPPLPIIVVRARGVSAQEDSRTYRHPYALLYYNSSLLGSHTGDPAPRGRDITSSSLNGRATDVAHISFALPLLFLCLRLPPNPLETCHFLAREQAYFKLNLTFSHLLRSIRCIIKILSHPLNYFFPAPLPSPELIIGVIYLNKATSRLSGLGRLNNA